MNSKGSLPPDMEALVQAEVQRRLEVIVAEQQQQFAAVMESAMRSATGGLHQAGDALEAEREAVIREKEELRELIERAEREGEAMAREAFERHWRQYEEASRLALLRTLVRRQIEAGMETPAIASLFMVEKDFVEDIREVVDRVDNFRRTRAGSSVPDGARVLLSTEGRGGTVTYESPGTRFELWWEFSSQALALVEVPTAGQWVARTGLPLESRDDVLAFIGSEIVARQAPGGDFTIGDNVLAIYSGAR